MYWERGEYREACAVATNAAPYVHARLQSVEAKVAVDVAVMTRADERREKARQAILEAFAERPPLVVDGQYHVIGGRAVPTFDEQPSVGENVGSNEPSAAEPQDC